MTSKRIVGLGLWLLAPAFVQACGGESEPRACQPGESRDCVCPGGRLGNQVCTADGLGWEDCDCTCTPDCDGKACGPDGCGGSCGPCLSPPAPACADLELLDTWSASGTCVTGGCQYVLTRRRCEFGCAEGACLPDPCAGVRCQEPPGVCHAAQGRCVRAPAPHCEYEPLEDGASCEDGLYCNGAESCQAGACQPGQPVDCGGLTAPCRAGACDEAGRACIEVLSEDGASCEDGLYCNGAESCQAGACQPGQPVDCGSLDNACQRGVCDEQGRACGQVAREDGTPCEDGVHCNGAESCQAGACAPGAPVSCTHLDGPCTQGVCREDPAGCASEARNEGQPCPDGLLCNGQELCQAGACQPGQPVDCPQPENPCRRAECQEAAGGCQDVDLRDGLPCTTGAACAASEICLGGQCQPHTFAPPGTPCEDGDDCTAPDTCLQGQCLPGSYVCQENVVIMMYLAADNNLDPYITADWHEMEAARVDDFPWLRVFVLLDRAGNNNTRFYEVHNNASTRLAGPAMGLTATGTNEELNMGHPNTLGNFITDVQAITGTDNAAFFLILSDHGDGWRNQAAARPKEVTRAVCGDDTSGGDYLTTRELGQAVSGKGLRLIGFDACLMGMAEVAYELRNHARIMVASQETEPGEGWAFTNLFRQFGQGGDSRPEAFGQLVADTYMASYGSSASELTMAVHDLSRMDALAAAVGPAASALQALSASNWSQVCSGLEWYGCFWTWCEPHADMIQIATRAKARDPAHAAAYDGLVLAVQDAVLYERHGTGHPNARGLTVYFPCDQSFDSAYSATNLQWAQDTTWETMLQAH
jgi:hypothetical protein